MGCMEKLVIVGAGGFGREIAATVGAINRREPRFDLLGFCDDAAGARGRVVAGLPVLGTIEDVAAGSAAPVRFFCAVGSNEAREKVAERGRARGWLAAGIIDPSAVVGPRTEVGEGAYIAALCVVSVDVRIGRHAILNQACSLGHDAMIGDFAQICPGARVSGFAKVGRSAFMGSNAVLGPGGTLGDGSVLGASSFATREVPPGATAMGNPARVVFQRT